MKKYKVTISKAGRIPHIGNGPITHPIIISDELYNELTNLGYPIKVIKTIIPSINNSQIKFIDSKKDVIKEELSVEEIKNQENEVQEISTDGNKEEIIEEDINVIKQEEIETNEKLDEEENNDEEILVDDTDLSADSFYTEKFLQNKNVCKKILNSRKVTYESSASLAFLRKLVLQSNPEIEFDEE